MEMMMFKERFREPEKKVTYRKQEKWISGYEQVCARCGAIIPFAGKYLDRCPECGYGIFYKGKPVVKTEEKTITYQTSVKLAEKDIKPLVGEKKTTLGIIRNPENRGKENFMETKKENFDPKQIGLENEEGFILKPEEAIKQAYAENALRVVALTPGLDPEVKKQIIEKAENAGDLAGKDWREENKDRLIKEYKNSINQGPRDQILAQKMALAEAPYREAAQIEGISNEQKDLILSQGEVAATEALMNNYKQRIKELTLEGKSAAAHNLERWVMEYKTKKMAERDRDNIKK